MKQKMTSKLKELFPNLGLTDVVIDQVSGIAAMGMAQDADDAAITERAKSFEAMLKAFQSDTDRRVNEAIKKAGNKGGDDDDPNKGGSGKNDDIMKILKEMKESAEAERKSLMDRISVLEGNNAAKAFDETVASVAKELGLTGAWLTLAKKGLSSDMDAAKIKEEMGATKKLMVEAGATVIDQLPGNSATDEEAKRKEAADWVNEHAVKE